MDDAKQQLIDKLQKANNILVTVSRDPSVDQLASCIGLTLMLNKQGKHAAAVFSGKVPSTLEFLKPSDTLEKNTDSLRDFIISLDKGKADKLRYKVEEDVVRIFITPYKTSLSADDLEFSEGDFNVDVVVALGVKKQEDLDQAITAHGRILHDATVASVNTSADAGLGSINWHDPQASSLSELVTDLSEALDGELLDEQIATALLTGIVFETGRFSNDRTSSQTMSASALLLSAGANQQLVASKLESKRQDHKASASSDPDKGSKDTSASDDGELEIDHTSDAVPREEPPAPPPPPAPAPPPPAPPKPEVPASGMSRGPKLVTEPPKLGGTLTANSEGEHLDPVTDPFSLPQSEAPALLTPPPEAWQPPAPAAPAQAPPPAPVPPPPAPKTVPDDSTTLTEIEKSVDSPHLAPADIDAVRGEVDKALAGSAEDEPITALNAQPLGGGLHAGDQPAPPAPSAPAPAPAASDTPSDTQGQGDDPDAPPPVPPPIPFQFGNSPPPQ